MGARLLLALSAATFMPAGSGFAAGLGGPERRGRALSMVIGGLTVAIIAGVPLGVLLGDALGWRATFLTVAGLAAISLLGILVWLPKQQPKVTATLGERLALARRPDILSVLATTVLTVASTFVVYTYLGVFLQAVNGLGPNGLAAVLLAFGVASALGTRVAGITADQLGRPPHGYLWLWSRAAGLLCPGARRGAAAGAGQHRQRCRQAEARGDAAQHPHGTAKAPGPYLGTLQRPKAG